MFYWQLLAVDSFAWWLLSKSLYLLLWKKSSWCLKNWEFLFCNCWQVLLAVDICPWWRHWKNHNIYFHEKLEDNIMKTGWVCCIFGLVSWLLYLWGVTPQRCNRVMAISVIQLLLAVYRCPWLWSSKLRCLLSCTSMTFSAVLQLLKVVHSCCWMRMMKAILVMVYVFILKVLYKN